MPFTFRKMSIPDVLLIEPKVFKDPRGFFTETYKFSQFLEAGLKEHFVQDNLSQSSRGILRGLHYQKAPAAQAKLVMVLQGEVFDVAVDIRKGSPTFGQWIGVTLKESDFLMLYIPRGFAHGFCVLSETATFMYKVSAEYAPENDRGIIWNDPDIGIEWPLSDPLLSEKDKKLLPLKQADNNFIYE